MARADLLKQIFQSYQLRDDSAFREAASALIHEERKKQHPVLANELELILNNGAKASVPTRGLTLYDPLPEDDDRQAPLIEIRRPKRYLRELVLDEKIVNVLVRFLVEFREWDVLEANGLAPIRRVLFCGPPGCGKTVTAEALAAELDLPLLYVRFDAVVSSLLGQTAANIRKVFEYASRGQWVVLFDEFDAIGRSRDDATEHSELKRVVNSFLQIMDSFQGQSLVIAATNFERALDPAVWRRFDEVVRFGLPTNEQLERAIRGRLSPLTFSPHDIHVLLDALSGGTYADAERVCLDVRRAAAIRGVRRAHRDDLHSAVERHSYRRLLMADMASEGTPTIDTE